MAVSIDWGQKIVNVPKADTQLVQSSPTEIRQLDLDTFRLDLNALQDNEQGITYLTTHNHVPPITVGGVTLARVVELINGYTVTFEDGQYAVNLVGANSNVADVTNVNQVSIRSANSAGLTFSDEINNQSFLGGAVWIDTVNGLTGTSFPRGTPTSPSLTFQDASIIASTNNFNSFSVFGSIPFLISDNISSKNFGGFSPLLTTLTFNSNNASMATFEEMTLAGTLNGEITAKACTLDNLSGLNGEFTKCRLEGNLTVSSSATNEIFIESGFSDVPGTSRPSLSWTGVTVDGQIRGYHGGLTISNIDQNINLSVDMDSGVLEVDSGCTNGTVVVRGVAELIDNSGVGCTVISSGLIDPTSLVTTAPKKRPGFPLT